MLIALMMEAVSISEASVSFCQTTRRNIPEDSRLHAINKPICECNFDLLLPVLNVSTAGTKQFVRIYLLSLYYDLLLRSDDRRKHTRT
jgi:hypothetical protein